MKLGQTDMVKNVNVRVFSGTDKVGPIAHLGWTEMLRSGIEILHCNLDRTDRLSRFDRNVMKGNREITIPSR